MSEAGSPRLGGKGAAQSHGFGCVLPADLCPPWSGQGRDRHGPHKPARIIYRLLKYREAYVETGQEKYGDICRARLLKHLQKSADALGFQLTPKQPPA